VVEADLALAGPEPQRALDELVALMRGNQENAAVHRSLAWAFLMRRDLDNAVEHIRRALALDDSDPAMHYLYARWVNHGDDDGIRIESAGTRMGSELKAALKRDPDYAAALELLGLVELSDGETKAALANLGRASTLAPRRDRYYLNLGRAYEAAGNLDAARNLMRYASAGGDAALSREAEDSLAQLGKEHKRHQQWESAGLLPDPNLKHSRYENLQEAIDQDREAEAKGKSMAAPPDMRTVEYLQGRIVSVECGSPGAILKVSSAGRIWQMHVADRNAIVLIGVDRFDCGWRDAAVSINYKRSGDLQGDLISLEAN
jgi:tetratricopeptide (TPR) repeat protein